MVYHKQRFSFIGMSGVGKSSFGKRLATEFGLSFIDTDKVISKTYHQSLSQLILENGEDQFLMNEESCILSLELPTTFVLATGGSVIYSKKVCDFLKAQSTVVFLDDTITNIMNRIASFSQRGFIKNGLNSVEEVFHYRYELYKSLADIHVVYPQPFSEKSAYQLILKQLDL